LFPFNDRIMAQMPAIYNPDWSHSNWRWRLDEEVERINGETHNLKRRGQIPYGAIGK
jgi:hypothetical protein